jgi:hypothetical protein
MSQEVQAQELVAYRVVVAADHQMPTSSWRYSGDHPNKSHVRKRTMVHCAKAATAEDREDLELLLLQICLQHRLVFLHSILQPTLSTAQVPVHAAPPT